MSEHLVSQDGRYNVLDQTHFCFVFAKFPKTPSEIFGGSDAPKLCNDNHDSRFVLLIFCRFPELLCCDNRKTQHSHILR